MLETRNEQPRAERPVVKVSNLVKHFAVRAGAGRRGGGRVKAVDGVSFEIASGETLGLVGESGCGKSTTARTMLHLAPPTAGDVILEGESLAGASPARLRSLRRRMQLVFQDPSRALNPRRNLEAAVGEGLLLAGLKQREERAARVRWILERVGLDAQRYIDRYPHELSGGQRQRAGIARALVLRPGLIVLDEPVSSLDASVGAQILKLLRDLQGELQFAALFISHDLWVVRHMCRRVAVMYLGQLVEVGPAKALYDTPQHPYTRALLDSIPAAHPADRKPWPALDGEAPGPARAPRGCRFHPRCPAAMERCRGEEPPLVEVSPGRLCRCFLYG